MVSKSFGGFEKPVGYRIMENKAFEIENAVPRVVYDKLFCKVEKTRLMKRQSPRLRLYETLTARSAI